MLQIFSLISLVISLSFSARAYVGSVSAATGDSGRAAVEASDTPFLNPAAVAYLRGYYFTASYGATAQGETGTQALALSLTENMKETVVPTSLAYSQSAFDNGLGETVNSKDFRLSFANFVHKSVALGFGIHHRSDELTMTKYAQTNLDAAALWAISDTIGVAGVLTSLMAPPSKVPEMYRFDQTMAFGATYNYKQFMRIKADIVSATDNSFNKPTLEAGMESYMNRWMILRWGVARNNELNANLYTAGLGWVLPRFGLHYAYQNSPQDKTLARHSVDLAIPVW